jgi:hypothetical protein
MAKFSSSLTVVPWPEVVLTSTRFHVPPFADVLPLLPGAAKSACVQGKALYRMTAVPV